MTVSGNALNAETIVLPLTPLQGGMLAASLSRPGKGLYTTQAIFTLSGEVDAHRWQQSWERVSERYDALRVGFVWDRSGEPVQVVGASRGANFTVVDLDADDSFELWLDNDRSTAFEPDRPPLYRHTLVRRQSDRDLHVFSFHHALLDGWSVEYLVREALAIYNDPAAVSNGSLTEPVPLRRYLAWYRKQTGTAAEYWRGHLRNFDRPLTIPGDLSPGADANQDSELVLSLGPALSQRIQAAAAGLGSTPSIIFQAVWAVLLARVSGESEVVFGIVSSGRDAPVPGITETVGLLINALPLRVTLDGEQTFQDLCQTLTALVSDASRSAHLTPSVIHQQSNVPPGQKLFETMLVFESVPTVDSTRPGLTIVRRRYVDRTDIPLSCLVLPGSEIAVKFTYDQRRFTHRFIRSLSQAFQSGLDEVSANPGQRLSSIRFGVAADPGEAAATPAPVPRLAEQLMSAFDHHANRCAVSRGEARITYQDLGVLVLSAAGYLAEEASAQPVVIYRPVDHQSVALVVACILVGRPYVFVDPDYPAGYLDRILNKLRQRFDAPSLVTADEAQGATMDATATVRLLSLDDLFSHNALKSPAPDPEALAYIVFTSGSTGEPKGVPISHRNLDYSNHCRTDYYGPVGRFLLLSSLSFDSSVAGLFWTLATGGELVLTPGPIRESLDQLATLVSERQVTHTLCLPSVYETMRAQHQPGELDSLETVIVAGESCPPELIRDHRRLGSSIRLYNEYGPSEATVWCSVAELATRDKSPEVSIGAPLRGTRIRIENSKGEPLPAGLPGELVIEGPGVFAGYLGTQKDADVKPGSVAYTDRAYASGDLAYRTEHGLTLLGRIDSQVKVRGQRIECEQVEALLTALDPVTAAVVTPIKSVAGASRLVAYVETSGENQPESGDLIEALRDQLPEAAVPAQIVILDGLPRLPNGKLDRKSLSSRALETVAVDAPTGDVNAAAMIRSLMGRIIGAPVESDTLSFFDAGGDSLSAVRLLEAVNEEFEVKLNLAELYQSPSPSGIADAVNRASGRDDWLAVTPIQSGGTRPPLFFAYGNAAKLAAVLDPEQPVYWVVHGRHGIVLPTDTISNLAAAHLEKIRKIRPTGPYHLAGFSLGALIVIEMARTLRSEGEQVDLLALIDPTSPQRFVTRSRWRRLNRYWISNRSLGEKLKYTLDLAVNAPRILKTRLGRPAMTTEAETLMAGGVTLHTGAKLSRESILASVEDALRSYVFNPCPGGAVLIQPSARSQDRLDWRDEALYWEDLFEADVEWLVYPFNRRHTDLYADEAALAHIGEWITARIDPT